MGLMRAQRPGITLLETLLVVSIMSVLLGLGAGAALTVSREARSTMCRSNLKQLCFATESYRNIYSGGLPAAILYYDDTGGVRTEAWDFIQSPDGEVRPGALWSYTDGLPEVNQCPSYVGPSNFGADPFTGYNYNTTFLGAEGQIPWTNTRGERIQGWRGARAGLPVALHRRPDSCALFGDGGFRNGANKFMRAPMNTVEYDLGIVYAGAQAYRHDACCNVVHLDGHCSKVRNSFEGTHAQSWLLQHVMGYPENAFLSDDDTAYDPR